jgi:hypothetical protein
MNHFPRWPQTMILLISAYQVAVIMGVSYHTQPQGVLLLSLFHWRKLRLRNGLATGPTSRTGRSRIWIQTLGLDLYHGALLVGRLWVSRTVPQGTG